MARFGHGDVPEFGVKEGVTDLIAFKTKAFVAGGREQPSFGYMFSDDPNERPPENDRLPEDEGTVGRLDALGDAMGSADDNEPEPIADRVQAGDGSIPAGYTYFGQFIDHDITVASGGELLMQENFQPLDSLGSIRNGRTPLLELDSVYGDTNAMPNPVPAPVGKKMVVGEVTDVGDQVPGKSSFNDLPRKLRSPDTSIDREAKIGDPRNDENLIVAQLHVAFLKAHNTLADQSASFEEARTKLIQIYQSAVWDDFLPRICDGETLGKIERDGPRFFTTASSLFMPIEFSAAGFRFGHSMVRNLYDFNLNFSPAESEFFFTFTALSGTLNFQAGGEGFDTFPGNWIIQWERFVSLNGSAPQRARPIDTKLTPILADLRDTLGRTQKGNIAPKLAKRNLRRGYLFSLPTGQAVANKIGVDPIDIANANLGLGASLAPFSDRTPLWLYVLAEAELNEGKLGAVGTTILAETFHTLISRSKPSIFDSQGNRTSTARHSLADILKLAEIQDNA